MSVPVNRVTPLFRVFFAGWVGRGGIPTHPYGTQARRDACAPSGLAKRCEYPTWWV